MQVLRLIFTSLSIWGAASCLKYIGSGSMSYDINVADEIFAEYIDFYKLNYVGDEYNKRLHIFIENLKKINQFNAEAGSGDYGLTPFVSITFDEFQENSPAMEDSGEMISTEFDDSAYGKEPEKEIDWREKNVLAPIQSQGGCGSCWAFSTTATLESQFAIQNGPPVVPLSQQILMDCSGRGCHGGGDDMARGFNIVYGLGGIMTAEIYPYTESDDKVCKFNYKRPDFKIDKVHFLRNLTTLEMQKLVSNYGPISIGILATQKFLFFTGKEILKVTEEDCPKDRPINHAINIVGYGTENGSDYWILRNSHGRQWGDQGYGKMLRTDDFLCGVGTQVSFADVYSPNQA